MNKDMKKLIAKVEAQGGTTRITRNGHIQFREPGGRVIALAAGTSGGGRSWANLLSELRRGGFDV